MNYQERLYSIYVSGNTSYLYGPATIKGIRKQFPVWKGYFGRFLPEDKEARILDLGCGNGAFVYFLQRHLRFKHTQGVDISKEQVEVAKKLGIENIIQQDLKNFLSEKKEVYHAIFCRDVIEHFTKDEILEILALIYSALKPGGIIVIQAPNAEGPFGSRHRYWEFTHEIAFTYSSLRSILVATGFRKISFYPAGPVSHGIISCFRFLIWKIIETLLRFYMLVETGSARCIFTQNIIAEARK